MRKTHYISVTVEEGKRGILASNLPHFSPRTSTELLTEPNTRRNTTDYPEGIQRCCLCLQGGITKIKAQLKPNLAKADKDKEKGYSKDIENTRMTKKTLGPLFSDTGECGGCLPSPTLERTVWIITKVKMGICVHESNKQNCLTGYRPKPGHVTREQEACQLHQTEIRKLDRSTCLK